MRRASVASASVAVAVVAALAATTHPAPALAGPGAPQPPATVATRPAAPIAGETTVIAGRFPRKDGRRAVVLQQQAGSGWKRLERGRTSASGAYRFALRVPARATGYRVLAPRASRPGRVLPARTSRTTVLRPAAQTVVLVHGASVVSGGSLRVSVRTTPARTGRPVTVQLRGPGGGWRTVRSLTTSARGEATLALTAPAAGTWALRAVAAAFHGAPAATSPTSHVTVTPGAADVLAYEVVAVGSKTIERGTQNGTSCQISTTRTRQTTATRPAEGSPAVWREGLPEGGDRVVDIHPDVSSTYVDDLDGCQEDPLDPSAVVPCAKTRDWSRDYPTDRITVTVRIPRGSTTGEVRFYPPSARNLGYPGAWDESCRVHELQNGALVPLGQRTETLPLSTLLGTAPFRVHTAGIFKDDFTRGTVHTVLTSTWDQSITLRRVPVG